MALGHVQQLLGNQARIVDQAGSTVLVTSAGNSVCKHELEVKTQATRNAQWDFFSEPNVPHQKGLVMKTMKEMGGSSVV